MLFILINLYPAFSQKNYSETDLLKKLSSAKSDSQRVNLMIDFSITAGDHSSIKNVEYALKAIELSKKINYFKGTMAAYQAAGDAYWYVFNYDKSVDYYLLELKLADSLNMPSRKAKANYNIGWIKCVQQGIYSERSKLINALKVFERLKDTVSILQVCNALASVYQNRYNQTHQHLDSANYYFRGMIFLGENSRYKTSIVTIYGNYSLFLIEQKRFSEAKKYLLKSLDFAKNQKDTFDYVNNKTILAYLYYHTDSLSKAKEIIDEIFPIIKNKDYKPNLADCYKTLYLLYQKEKDYKKAFEYHLLYKEVNDTLNSIIFKSSLQEKETAYEINKREENIRELQQSNEVSKLKNKQNNYIMGGMALVALLIIAFALNLYRSNQNKQEANLKLSEQNRIIAEKKHEIEQSILYAKGIQNAVLPTPEDLKRELPESFLIYLPKDVVSGDFYWMHVCKNEDSESTTKGVGSFAQSSPLLIAAADCTGHGVPGSLMSIVSIDKLNQAVLGKKLTTPGKILSSINNDIKNALKQETAANTQKDGLDIALLYIDFVKLQLLYSGAHRPVWIIRDGNLMEYKATKTSIAGHTPFDFPFEEHHIPLQKNDLVLLSSDGYADQFGGPSGKKMMTRSFKEKVVKIAGQSVPQIEQILLKHFTEWKGQYEQVDDVLVIGFKI